MTPIFVTGVGTGVGKTWLMTTLIRQWREQNKVVHAYKPVVTGYESDEDSTDTRAIVNALGQNTVPEWIDRVSPWRFKAPLSPDIASACEQQIISEQEIIQFCRHRMDVDVGDFLLIEGVGGVLVPLNHQSTVADWIAQLDIPVIVVTGTYLGSINHTLLTLKYLQNIGIRKLMLVVNESEHPALKNEEMIASIQHHVNVPVISVLRETKESKVPSITHEIERWL